MTVVRCDSHADPSHHVIEKEEHQGGLKDDQPLVVYIL